MDSSKSCEPTGDGERALRVLVNDRPLRQTLTGVGHYIAEILTELPAADAMIHAAPFFFTYLSRKDWRGSHVSHDAPNGPAVRPTARHPRDIGGSRKPWWLRRIMQGAYGGLFRLAAGRYDVYHEPNHIPMRCGLPTVTTIHDLSVLVHPQWHPADRVRWYEREFEAGVRRTRRFIAASEFTKREMVARIGVSPERICVTYQAPRAAFRRKEQPEIERTLGELGLSVGFFLYVGTLEPRKNVSGLLDAYGDLPAALRERFPLVVVGAWGWKQHELREQMERRGLSAHLRLMGYLRDEQMAVLYSACAAFVWPTLYEGFGMPPLEAMACGAPVIVSDVASLPEVVGEAGTLLDPHQRGAWCEAMRRAAEDADWRESTRAGSLEQAAKFSWQRCARQTAACYRLAAEEATSR